MKQQGSEGNYFVVQWPTSDWFMAPSAIMQDERLVKLVESMVGVGSSAPVRQQAVREAVTKLIVAGRLSAINPALPLLDGQPVEWRGGVWKTVLDWLGIEVETRKVVSYQTTVTKVKDRDGELIEAYHREQAAADRKEQAVQQAAADRMSPHVVYSGNDPRCVVPQDVDHPAIPMMFRSKPAADKKIKEMRAADPTAKHIMCATVAQWQADVDEYVANPEAGRYVVYKRSEPLELLSGDHDSYFLTYQAARHALDKADAAMLGSADRTWKIEYVRQWKHELQIAGLI